MWSSRFAENDWQPVDQPSISSDFPEIAADAWGVLETLKHEYQVDTYVACRLLSIPLYSPWLRLEGFWIDLAVQRTLLLHDEHE